MFPCEPGPCRAALGLQARGPGRQLQHPGQEGRRRRVIEAWGGFGKVLLGLGGQMCEPQPVLLWVSDHTPLLQLPFSLLFLGKELCPMQFE